MFPDGCRDSASKDFQQTVGRKTGRVAKSLLHLAVRQILASHVGEFVKLAIDDSPTRRYGPQVEPAGIHHKPKRSRDRPDPGICTVMSG